VTHGTVGLQVVDRLPEVVASRLNNMVDLCFFGLLPELGLAWVSVDDALCLWVPATTVLPPRPYRRRTVLRDSRGAP
jgi:hypothetical protein